MNKNDYSKEDLINMVEILQTFVDFYREKLLEKGFTKEQLRCYDIECCENMARKMAMFNGFTDEEWNNISDLAYNDFVQKGL